MSGQFKIVGEIGRGAYGKVFKAYNMETKESVAIKKIHVHENKLTQAMLREATLLLDIKHPNIVSLLQPVYIDNEDYCLVFEYLSMNLLTHKMQCADQYPDITKRFMKGILQAVHYCHSNGVIHRDLKLSNVLVDTTTTPHTVKVADFGLARGFITTETTLTPEVVTLNYRPPELLLRAVKYTEAIDIWSIGCIMAELVLIQDSVSTVEKWKGNLNQWLDKEANLEGPVRTPDILCSEKMDTFDTEQENLTNEGNLMDTTETTTSLSNVGMKHSCLFKGNQEIQVLESIFRILGTPTEDVWPGVTSLPGYLANIAHYEAKELGDFVSLEPSGLDLLSKLLCLNPSLRISAKDALDHAYFK